MATARVHFAQLTAPRSPVARVHWAQLAGPEGRAAVGRVHWAQLAGPEGEPVIPDIYQLRNGSLWPCPTYVLRNGQLI